MKILEFLWEETKEWKSTIPWEKQENHKILELNESILKSLNFWISQETCENHKNIWTPYANLENHESLRIIQENHENHENTIILQRIMKKIKIIEFRL